MSAKPRKSVVRIGGDSRTGHDRSKFDRDGVDSGEIRDNKVGKKGQNLFKSKNLSKSKKTLGSDFFTPRDRLAFTKLRQAFIIAPILHHFDSEHYIRVEMDVSGYVICEVLSQLTSDN